MRRRRIPIALAVAAGLALPASAAAQVAGLPPTPIPAGPGGSPAPFEGNEATPHPVTNASAPPRHPFMAPNERSNIHNDAYMTDSYRVPGPLGRGTTTSSNFFVRECGSVTFDSLGRLIAVCVGVDRPVLALMDPETLAVLAAMPLPPRNVAGGPNIFNNFSGGGYFYLDNRDHAIIPTTDHHIYDISVADGGMGPSFVLSHDYDVSAAIATDDGIISALPDWNGLIWFVTGDGVVGTVDTSTSEVKAISLPGERISNSFAVDETGGVYIVTDAALYRFDAGPGGTPSVTWREQYPDSGIHKPGQSDAGSGTTPTLMGDKWVSIADNADPMDVVIYRRARDVGGLSREICRQPVFANGAGSTDNSLIGTDSAVVVENNYGYSGPTATEMGGVTEPGLARVDITATPVEGTPAAPTVTKVKASKKKRRRHGKKRRRKRPGKLQIGVDPPPQASRFELGCRVVWQSDERAPSVVPKLSLANGLVYTYTKPPREDDGWYLTALDFRTGATVYRRLAGVGLGFNNNYAPVTLGPDGAAYVGVLGGLTRFSDTP